jgi:DNA segregation ATPase FtsK/SpoIIIE, S-DNA-T family
MSKAKIDLSMLSSVNDDRYISLKDCLTDIDLNEYEIPICLGRDSDNNNIIRDFVDIKSILMAGGTGSGKSAFINSFINTLLLTKTPEELKLVMIDPKMIELPFYDGLDNLLFPPVTDMEKALQALIWCTEEIERRKKEPGKKPHIIIIVDEFSDLMLSGDGIDSKLEDIAKNGSDVGVYMLLSSSRPADEIFTKGLLDLIPVRLAGALVTERDSITVIGESGAEDLLGMGDMLYKNIESHEVIRVQAPYISYGDMELILSKVSKKSKYINLKKLPIEEKDHLFEDAKRVVLENGNSSTSNLQRRLQVNYIRAKKLIELLEDEGIINK